MCDSILTVVPANAAALYNMREPVINNIIIYADILVAVHYLERLSSLTSLLFFY